MAKKKNHTTFSGHFTETMGVKPDEASLDQLNDYYGRIAGDMKNLSPLNTWFMKQRRSAVARSIASDPETKPVADREVRLRQEARDPATSKGKVAIRGKWVSPPTEGEIETAEERGKDAYWDELKLAEERYKEARDAGAVEGYWPDAVDTRTGRPIVSAQMAQDIKRRQSGAVESSWSPLDLVGGSGWGAAGLGSGVTALGIGLGTPQGRAMVKAGAGRIASGAKAIRRLDKKFGVRLPVRSPLYRIGRQKATRAPRDTRATLADPGLLRRSGPTVKPQTRMPRNIKVKPGGSRKQLPKEAKSPTAKRRARAKAARQKRDEARGKQRDRTPNQKAADQKAQATANKQSQQASINRGKTQKPQRASKSPAPSHQAIVPGSEAALRNRLKSLQEQSKKLLTSGDRSPAAGRLYDKLQKEIKEISGQLDPRIRHHNLSLKAKNK